MTEARPIAAIALLVMSAMAPLLITPAGAQQLSDRAKHIGGKFMCMCGCSQVLTECNHIRCPSAVPMLKELNQTLANGGSEQTITHAFLQEYGTQVYAEPPKSGFSLVAWALPSIYLIVGTGVVIFVISRWRKRPAQQASLAGGDSGISPELLERARAQASRETQD